MPYAIAPVGGAIGTGGGVPHRETNRMRPYAELRLPCFFRFWIMDIH